MCVCLTLYRSGRVLDADEHVVPARRQGVRRRPGLLPYHQALRRARPGVHLAVRCQRVLLPGCQALPHAGPGGRAVQDQRRLRLRRLLPRHQDLRQGELKRRGGRGDAPSAADQLSFTCLLWMWRRWATHACRRWRRGHKPTRARSLLLHTIIVAQLLRSLLSCVSVPPHTVVLCQLRRAPRAAFPARDAALRRYGVHSQAAMAESAARRSSVLPSSRMAVR